MTFADATTKRCWKCARDLSISRFNKNRSKSSGLSAECKECVAAYNKQHVANNIEYYQEYRAAKRQDKIAWYLFLECRTRAKRNGLDFNLDPEDISVPKTCPVFGFELRPRQKGDGNRDLSPSVDRIDTSLGYIKGNVQVISYLANRMKSNASSEQLAQFARWILDSLESEKLTAESFLFAQRTDTIKVLR